MHLMFKNLLYSADIDQNRLHNKKAIKPFVIIVNFMSPKVEKFTLSGQIVYMYIIHCI